MPILSTIAITLAAKCTIEYLTESVFTGFLGNRADAILIKTPSLVKRIQKQFSDTHIPVNHNLQKAILSAHWMATKVFAEKLRKEAKQVDGILIVLTQCDLRLKELGKEKYELETISPDAHEVDNLILMGKTLESVEELRAKVIEFHLEELSSACGDRTVPLTEYIQLTGLIKNGWGDENLDWLTLMTAFLNELLKGDNNKAKDAYQNQELAKIGVDVVHIIEVVSGLEKLTQTAKEGIGLERFEEFWGLLREEISDIKNISLENLQINKKILEKIEETEAKHNTVIPSEVYERSFLNKLLIEISDLNLEFEKERVKKEKFIKKIDFETDEGDKRLYQDVVNSCEKTMLGIDRERTEKEEAVEGFVSNSIDNYVTVMSFDTENDSEFEQIQALYKEGRYDEGDEIIDVSKLNKQVNQRLNVKASGRKKDETLVTKLLYLAKRILAKKEADWFSQVNNYFMQAVELHESYETCFTYANFLSSHGEPDQAFTFLEKALTHAIKPFDKANTINSLGGIYMDNIQFKDAGIKYIEALEIYEKLAKNGSPKYYFEIAGACNNLGRVHSQIGPFEKAEAFFNRAIEIYQSLIELGFGIYKYNLVVTFNNKGELLVNKALSLPTKERNKKLGLVEDLFQYALEVNQELVNSQREKGLSHLTKILNNLGCLKSYQGLNRGAETRHLEALVIRRKLAALNPNAYVPFLADTLCNLASSQIDRDETQAERNYLEAFRLYENLVKVSPQQHSLRFANVAIALAFFYRKNKKNKNQSIHFAELALRYFSPLSKSVEKAQKGKFAAEQILKEWE